MHEGDNLFVEANRSIVLDQPERGENFINFLVCQIQRWKKKETLLVRRRVASVDDLLKTGRQMKSEILP